MTNQVATLTSIQDRVKERIQSTFMELMPDEMFAGLVREHTDTFIQSTLPIMIRDALKASASDFIKKELDKPGWRERWEGQGRRAGDLMQTVIKEAAPELVNAMFSGIAAQLVMALRNGNLRI